MSEENEFNIYKNIVNNYFRTETFEKAKEFCARDMVQLNQRYITEAVCRNEALNRADKLEKENREYEYTIAGMVQTREDYFVSKDIIRKFIKEELPDDEIMKCCENFDVNGVYLRKKLEELLGE